MPAHGAVRRPRCPVETLVEQAGDCEDTAILYASLVRTLGAGAMLAAVDTDHVVALVPVDAAYAAGVTQGTSFWEYGGKLHAFAETTGDPHALGYYSVWDATRGTCRAQAS